MLSEEMLNLMRKNCATNGRLIVAALMALGVYQALPGVIVMALIALCAAYLSDFLMLMRVAAASSFFGFVSFVFTAIGVISTVLSLLS